MDLDTVIGHRGICCEPEHDGDPCLRCQVPIRLSDLDEPYRTNVQQTYPLWEDLVNYKADAQERIAELEAQHKLDGEMLEQAVAQCQVLEAKVEKMEAALKAVDDYFRTHSLDTASGSGIRLRGALSQAREAVEE